MVKIFHLAGEMSHGVPFELLVIDPPEENPIEDYAPLNCKIDIMQEVALEGKWDNVPSDTIFDRQWE